MGADENKQLADRDREELAALREFEAERARLRKVIGGIGGAKHARRDTFVNFFFLVVVVALLVHSLIVLSLSDNLLSLEIGLFLVSFKIVYMMHQNAKVNHFQFWVLNSLEFRLNSIERLLKKLASADKED